MKQRPQRSMAVAREHERRKMMAAQEIPDDIGVLPGTFVMPSGKNKPSWTKDFKNRWRLTKHWLRARMGDALQ